MVFGTFWKRLSAKQLAIFIQALSLIAIFSKAMTKVCTPSPHVLMPITDWKIQVL
jgi:hypothetical protein